ncbi:ISL3 family transposase [Alkalibacterium gilvum]|uniref:ISL3 family transposase n=1 Tax=Alkalibacterium gilvum TaxID=1130080 RepID=UPI003F8EB26B
MPTTNDIRNILDIQDKHITFLDNCVTIGDFKGKSCKFIDCTLTYHPESCVNCDVPNEKFIVFKNGTQTSRVTYPMAGIYPTYLRIKKQRYLCKNCGKSFTAKTPIVKRNCFISNYINAQILDQSRNVQSVKDIAKDTNVSEATVQRVLTNEGECIRPHYHSLPEHMSFDEFKYASGRMAFEYINVETGDILDILPAKDSRYVTQHFLSRYSLNQRSNVQTITIDMNASYISFIPKLFPNAKVIIDRFHIIQLLNRSMNKTRVAIMNQLNNSNGENQKKYRRLKRYWKKILKKANNISHTSYDYYRLFGQRTEGAIISEMLDYDPKLKATYDLYQSIIAAVEANDYERLCFILNQPCSSDVSTYLKTSLKTLRKHLSAIRNTFIYPYNNGRIEGINNKIKVLNRVAYGYRNFSNYKNRILLHFKLNPNTTQLSYKKNEEHVLAA